MMAHQAFSKAALLLLGAASLLLSGSSVHAIYPPDHFEYVTEINDADHLSSLVSTTIDAGKTLFVRWIASPG